MLNWIKIENRKPTQVVGKLFIYSDEEIEIAWWNNTFNCFTDLNNESVFENVTHWARIQDINLPE